MWPFCVQSQITLWDYLKSEGQRKKLFFGTSKLKFVSE